MKEDKPKETSIKERIELKDKLKALGVVELDSRIHSKNKK